MKKTLTPMAVGLSMNLLIEANGTTTTKEVKQQLRDLGYSAKQKKVSNIMNDLFNHPDADNEFTRELVETDGNEHFVYSIKSNTQTTVNTSNDDREPVEICYTHYDVIDKILNSSLTNTDKQNWVVFYKDTNDTEFEIYKSDLTRDAVRSRFASRNKVKIQDVRSRRIANF